MNSNHKQKGYALAELLVALGFLGLVVIFFTSSSTILGNISNQTQIKGQAEVLAREGLEVVRHLRDVDFSNLLDGVYGLSTTSNEWQLVNGSDEIDQFLREITISTVDVDTKFVESKISWPNKNGTSTVLFSKYLTNWQKIIETGVGDWSTSTIPVSLNYAGSQNGVEVIIRDNYAFIIRDGGNPNFIVLEVSDPQNPVLADSINVINSNLTDLYIFGNYAYISSTNKELNIVDISDPNNLIVLSGLDLQRNTDSAGIFVSGSYAYLTRYYSNQTDSFEFNVINISNPNSPVFVSGYNSTVDFRDIFVSGSYAYVTTSDTSGEIYVIDISNPNSPTLHHTFNISGNQTGWSITGTVDRLFFGSSVGNFYTIDSSVSNSLNILDSLNVGDAINDIDLGNSSNYAFLATNNDLAEFQVIDISDRSNIALLGQNSSFLADLNGVAYSEMGDFAIVVGNDDNSEVNIILPGP